MFISSNRMWTFLPILGRLHLSKKIISLVPTTIDAKDQHEHEHIDKLFMVLTLIELCSSFDSVIKFLQALMCPHWIKYSLVYFASHLLKHVLMRVLLSPQSWPLRQFLEVAKVAITVSVITNDSTYNARIAASFVIQEISATNYMDDHLVLPTSLTHMLHQTIKWVLISKHHPGWQWLCVLSSIPSSQVIICCFCCPGW